MDLDTYNNNNHNSNNPDNIPVMEIEKMDLQTALETIADDKAAEVINDKINDLEARMTRVLEICDMHSTFGMLTGAEVQRIRKEAQGRI